MKGFMLGCTLGVVVMISAVLLAALLSAYPAIGLPLVVTGIVLFFGFLFKDFYF